MSSVFTAKTGLSSILKAYSSSERDKAKNAIINKVRFEMPKRKGLQEVVKNVCETDNYQSLNEFVLFLKESDLTVSIIVTTLKKSRLIYINTMSIR